MSKETLDRSANTAHSSLETGTEGRDTGQPDVGRGIGKGRYRNFVNVDKTPKQEREADHHPGAREATTK